MKSCPTCNKTFTDPNLSFCIDDGTPLILVDPSADEITAVSPSPADRSSEPPPPTEVYKPREWQAPDYQPPGFEPVITAPKQKKAWPWVVGLMGAVGAGLIALAIGGLLVYKLLNPTNPANRNGESATAPSSNLNSNAAPANSNNDSSTLSDDDDLTPPPTDKDVVLASLRTLENEWTVANINADQKKLDRILADDYVGTSSEGRSQGKAEYLKTITRDTTIQKWEFEDLKVTLTGDRASLDGVIRLQVSDQEAAYKFTDKFVWRDARWQAVGSVISRIK
jgi:Domain of unknown function (DUF4440)